MCVSFALNLILTHEPFIVCISSPLSSWGGEWQSSLGGHLVSGQGQPTAPTMEINIITKF